MIATICVLLLVYVVGAYPYLRWLVPWCATRDGLDLLAPPGQRRDSEVQGMCDMTLAWPLVVCVVGALLLFSAWKRYVLRFLRAFSSRVAERAALLVPSAPKRLLKPSILGFHAWDNERLVRLIEDQARWSQKTFGSDDERGPLGAIRHLRKEVDEIEANPDDPEEYADALLLLMDAGRRAGFSFATIVYEAAAKQTVNERRQWPAITSDNAEQPVEHIETQE